MSSITLTPAFGVRRTTDSARTGRTSGKHGAVRLTRRGRVVAVLVFLAVALAAMVAMGGLATATQDSGTPERVQMIEVQRGDTLYGIAGEVAEPGKVQEMVYKIKRMNSLPSVAISEGQRLAVPTR